MENRLTTLIDLLTRAAKCNHNAQELLHLMEGFPFNAPKVFNPAAKGAKSRMKDNLSEFIYFAAAAEKLELQFTARMARTELKYCMYAYNCLSDKTPTVHPVLNGQDVAEDTLTLVKDICLTTDMLLKVEQMEASRRAEEGVTLGEDGEGEEGEDAKEEQNEEEESEEEGEKNKR